MKQVDCTFHLSFSTQNADKLPRPSSMKNDLENLFSEVLDKYLHYYEAEGEEVHLILGDELTIEDDEDDDGDMQDPSICPHGSLWSRCKDPKCHEEMCRVEAEAYCPHGTLAGCPKCS
jgi:hypothetical protein